MMEKQSFITSVGRRKAAIARIRLMANAGQMTVNGKLINEYFPGPVFQKAYQKPFEVTKTLGKYSGTVLVAGVGTQWAAPTAVNAVVVGYYVAGFFVTLFGKTLKHQAGAECKVHGRR